MHRPSLGPSLWAQEDARQSLRALGRQGRVGGPVPNAGSGRRSTRSGPDRLLCRQGASLCRGRPRGERAQAIGRSRGGRTTKIHALTDQLCRPIAFLLTGGQVADCIAADELLDGLLTAQSCTVIRATTATPSVERSRARARSPTSHPKPIDVGRTASRRGSIVTATRSNGCSVDSRTFVVSQPATTDSHVTSWPPSASQPRSATGYESEP